MKKALCVVVFLFVAAQLPLWSYDQSPANWQVLPEAVWAAATGGGTWVTEVQITAFTSTSAEINCYFHYNGGSSANITLPYIVDQYHSLRSINILLTIDFYDSSSLVYYGKAGAVWFWTTSVSSAISVQAKTVNGNYGKTLPALGVVGANSVAQGRAMIIQDIMQTSTYRTNCGFFNSSVSATYQVTFRIIDSNNGTVGSDIVRTLGPYDFISLNPFAAAGVPSGTYTNCWLYIFATSGGTDVRGVMCYGSIANNSTNDTYALISRPFN